MRPHVGNANPPQERNCALLEARMGVCSKTSLTLPTFLKIAIYNRSRHTPEYSIQSFKFGPASFVLVRSTSEAPCQNRSKAIRRRERIYRRFLITESGRAKPECCRGSGPQSPSTSLVSTGL